MTSLYSSLAALIVAATCFFSGHTNAGTPPSEPARASRKKATATGNEKPKDPPAAFRLTVRSTSYSHDEDSSDSDSSEFRSKTRVPLTYWHPGKIGTAAVDFRCIPAGSLIIVSAEGKMPRAYLAADTGRALKTREASRELADLRGIKDERRTAPVVDFFEPGNGQVGSEWTEITVIPGNPNFMDLPVRQRIAYLKPGAWEPLIASCVTLPVAEKSLLAAR